MKKEYMMPTTAVFMVGVCSMIAESDPNVTVGDDDNPADPNDPVLVKEHRGGLFGGGSNDWDE